MYVIKIPERRPDTDTLKADKSDREKGSDESGVVPGPSHSTAADVAKAVAEPHVLYLWIGEGTTYPSICLSFS